MAAGNSIKRALLRPGHFLSPHSDRLLYVFPARSLGGFSRSLLPTTNPIDSPYLGETNDE